jgi:hypothetical protein
MPGTGKSSMIVAAIQALVARGSSVLLTSYTNSAVDNVALKLVERGVPFLRVGRPESVHPGVREYVVGGPRYPVTSLASMQELATKAPVVGLLVVLSLLPPVPAVLRLNNSK